MIEVVFTFMMVISCDLKAYRELESQALNNHQSIEEMMEEDMRSWMRRHYYTVKIKNMITKQQMRKIHDTRDS